MSSPSWAVYDGVASIFRTAAEPHFFTAPAEALVRLMGVGPGSRLLDAGAGTGAVCRAAAGAGASWIALDASVQMLLETPLPRRALAARLPSLPFAAASFTHATAAFVLSHVDEPEAFLVECTRVLRPGGTAGVTSWARDASDSPPGEVWLQMLTEATSAERLYEAIGALLPNEEAFADLDRFAARFASAPLDVREARRETFRTVITPERYVCVRTAGSAARFVRGAVGEERWAALLAEAVRTIEARFGAELEIVTEVNFVVAERR